MGPEAHFDGQTWRLWYTGMPVARSASGIGYYEIGLATSADGIRFHRANDGAAVLTRGSLHAADEVQSATPSILRDGEQFRMWYAAWSPLHGHTICTATSPDGIVWNRGNGGRPVSGLHPAEAYGHAVCKAADGYLLLYMALRAKPGLYAATSKDGVRWVMLNEGPVFGPGDRERFDSRLVGHPFLLPARDGRLLMWYTGYADHPVGPNRWRLRIGMASSAWE
jgi:hypothetical protein